MYCNIFAKLQRGSVVMQTRVELRLVKITNLEVPVLGPPLGARFLLFGLGVFALFKCNLGLLPLLKKQKTNKNKQT
jgi:hypothetical protein